MDRSIFCISVIIYVVTRSIGNSIFFLYFPPSATMVTQQQQMCMEHGVAKCVVTQPFDLEELKNFLIFAS